MNQVAVRTYEKMSDRFKNLVKIDNAHLALLMNVAKLPDKDLKPHSNQLFQINLHLTGGQGKKLEQCPYCFIPQQFLRRHQDLCKSLSSRRFLVLSLDGKTFMCQFGCPIRSGSAQEIYKHFANCHTYEELKDWGINKDLLCDSYDESKIFKQDASSFVKAEQGIPQRSIVDKGRKRAPARKGPTSTKKIGRTKMAMKFESKSDITDSADDSEPPMVYSR